MEKVEFASSMDWSFLGVSPEMMAAAENKKKKNIKNYRVNKTTKNNSSYAPISIDYRNLENDDYIQFLFNRIYNTIQTHDDGSFYSALNPVDPKNAVESIKMNKIDTDDDPTTFRTITDLATLKPLGVFSFTFYKPTISFSSLAKSEQLTASNITDSIRNYFLPESLETNIKRIYLQGLLKYAELTTEPAFENWKVVIYTDKYTINYFQNIHQQIMSDTVSNVIDILEYYHWLKLYSHPNVAILCVTMPAYSMNNVGEIVEYSVIRIARFHAFQLFPDVPVFVRDADTLFTKNPSYLFLKNDIYSEAMSEEDKSFLYNWEETFYENFKAKKEEYKFCIGVNNSYKKEWHYDPDKNTESLGIFAGFVSSLGNIQPWTDGTLWNSCMEYLQKHASMVKINSLPRNNNLYIKNNKTKKIANNISKYYRSHSMIYKTYIGKDEQVLIFNILPMIFHITYFYYLDIIDVGKAVFRNNSPLPTTIQNSGLYTLTKTTITGSLIDKIKNIFDTPEIHEKLKSYFELILQENYLPKKTASANVSASASANVSASASANVSANGNRMSNNTNASVSASKMTNNNKANGGTRKRGANRMANINANKNPNGSRANGTRKRIASANANKKMTNNN